MEKHESKLGEDGVEEDQNVELPSVERANVELASIEESSDFETTAALFPLGDQIQDHSHGLEELDFLANSHGQDAQFQSDAGGFLHMGSALAHPVPNYAPQSYLSTYPEFQDSFEDIYSSTPHFYHYSSCDAIRPLSSHQIRPWDLETSFEPFLIHPGTGRNSPSLIEFGASDKEESTPFSHCYSTCNPIRPLSSHQIPPWDPETSFEPFGRLSGTGRNSPSLIEFGASDKSTRIRDKRKDQDKRNLSQAQVPISGFKRRYQDSLIPSPHEPQFTSGASSTKKRKSRGCALPPPSSRRGLTTQTDSSGSSSRSNFSGNGSGTSNGDEPDGNDLGPLCVCGRVLDNSRGPTCVNCILATRANEWKYLNNKVEGRAADGLLARPHTFQLRNPPYSRQSTNPSQLASATAPSSSL